jgi:hypothetical protein
MIVNIIPENIMPEDIIYREEKKQTNNSYAQ